MNNFKEFKIPCLQTFDEIKKICKDLNLRLKIPNSSEKNFRELIRLKRERDEQDKFLESQLRIKRERDEQDNLDNQLKIKRFKTSTSDDENQDHNYSKKIDIIDLTLKLDDKPTQKVNHYVNSIIEKLDNFMEIQNLMNFYNELNNYANNLNKELIKFNNTPIIVENKVDNDLPPKFNYVNEYCLNNLDDETLETIKTTVHRCDCKYDCIEYSRNGNPGCCYAKLTDDKCFYNSNGLIKSTVTKRGPIIECTEYCKCSDKCPNRIIQNGTKVKLAIFKTNDGRGWGLKALEKIQKNKFICTYRGEILTNEEALRRQAIHSEKYFFDLDYNEELQFEYVVDATNTASLGRFLNHSCYANCETFMAYVENCYVKTPVIAFFTNRAIKANEELTIDYFMGNEYKLSDEKIINRTNCKCKSASCKGYSFC